MLKGCDVVAKINKTVGNVNVKIDTSRIDQNLKEAQRALTNQVWADCTPLVPFQQGGLRNNVSMSINADYIEWNSPYAHYIYSNELYLAANGSSWAKKHEKKYPAGKPLHYHPEGAGTTGQWFEEAKRLHKDEWVKLVQRIAGKD